MYLKHVLNRVSMPSVTYAWLPLQNNTLTTTYNATYGLASVAFNANGSTSIGEEAYITAGANPVLRPTRAPNLVCS